jgi:hypothetical protein
MAQQRDNEKTPDSNSPAQTGNNKACKKPYVSPVLVEYGTIAKLTQGTKTKNADGKNSKLKASCL